MTIILKIIYYMLILFKHNFIIKKKTMMSKVKPKKAIDFKNTLQYLYPDIAKEWHPIKNGNIKPDMVNKGSDAKVWWLCPEKCKYACLHEYESKISNRTYLNNGCPYCNGNNFCIHESFGFKYPELAKEWHPTKNGNLTPLMFKGNSSQLMWWLCSGKNECSHEYKAKICNRKEGKKCPYCNAQNNLKKCVHNSVKYLYPELMKEWHPTKNINLDPETISYSSDKLV